MDQQPTEQKPGWLLLQIVTLARIPAAFIFCVVLLFTERTTLTVVVCIALLLLVETTDMVDGHLARRYDLASEWGAMLDPYADSISRLVVFWTLAQDNLVLVFVPLVMALRDITVSYCRIALTRRGRTVSARWGGKAKAWIQGTAGVMAYCQPILWGAGTEYGQGDFGWTLPAISWIVAVSTAASAIQYVQAALSAAREAPPASGS